MFLLKKPQIENNDPVIKNELNSTTYKVNGRRSSEESVDKQHESVFNGNTLKRAYANEGQSMQFKKVSVLLAGFFENLKITFIV